jgi:DNA-binding NtrC family response regulator
MTSATLSMSMPCSPAITRSRVLCVDDEPNVLRALNWLLQKDFDVTTATSGHEGLKLVREATSFDVIISDQRMPEMSGVDFLREARAISPRAMRILLTGYSDMQAILRSVNESEIFRYVNKPWNVADLPKVVAQAAEIARSLPEAQFDPEPLEDAALAASSARILVLDEDPGVHAQAELAVGDYAEVIHTSSVVDAIQQLQSGNISVIVTETHIGTVDSTRLIRLLKQRYPEIVTVVLAEESGADLVSSLINQGQIYRFVPKPIKAGYLKIILRSAIAKHQQLKQDPALLRRHQVEAISDESARAFEAELIESTSVARNTINSATNNTNTSKAYGFSGFLKRLFAH